MAEGSLVLKVPRTRGTTDIVEGELGDSRVELEEERERLADAASGTKDGNFGELKDSMVLVI